MILETFYYFNQFLFGEGNQVSYLAIVHVFHKARITKSICFIKDFQETSKIFRNEHNLWLGAMAHRKQRQATRPPIEASLVYTVTLPQRGKEATFDLKRSLRNSIADPTLAKLI